MAQYFTALELSPGASQMTNVPYDTSWDRARAACEVLGGRLPSEAEWEYAARAGTETDYYCGNDQDCLEKITWYCNGEYDFCNYNTVAQKEPNAFGLYDMIGNLAEYCEDTDQGSYEGAPTNGSAWIVESDPPKRHIVRGGFLSVDGLGIFKVWLRWDQDSGSFHVGIRCARDLQEEDGDAEEIEEDNEQED